MGSSYNVLIADDQESLRSLLVLLLSRGGHNCETAKDGIEALEKVRESSFDSAVLDIIMPRMDGITLTRELVKLYPDLPIMVMTGHALHSAESAISAGALEFLRKPFSTDEFLLRFDRMMREHRGKETLRALSLTDELTNLYNRRRFFDLAEQNLKMATLLKKRSLLLYIDMDDLKWINDNCGHNEGDKALIALAGVIKQTFRESDIIARIGGDEFVILLESTDENDKTVTTRLQENLRNYNNKLTIDYNLSVSIGAAPFDPDHPVSIDELLDQADSSMYVQKGKRNKKEFRSRSR
jgi:diguanylate cyclase (GGDEF)-like protein